MAGSNNPFLLSQKEIEAGIVVRPVEPDWRSKRCWEVTSSHSASMPGALVCDNANIGGSPTINIPDMEVGVTTLQLFMVIQMKCIKLIMEECYGESDSTPRA